MTSMTSLLLDTHAFLWWRTNDRRLLPEARSAIASADRVMVSTASAWEAALKVAIGRLRLPEPFSSGVDASGFERLAITFEHADEAAALPPYHGDPFDRMLVAQARVEWLTLVSHDQALKPYEVKVLWT